MSQPPRWCNLQLYMPLLQASACWVDDGTMTTNNAVPTPSPLSHCSQSGSYIANNEGDNRSRETQEVGYPPGMHPMPVISCINTNTIYLHQNRINSISTQHHYHMALDYLSIPATSTSVERVFSQGCHLLPFSHNSLSPSSVCAFLYFGSWSFGGIAVLNDIIGAVTVRIRA